MNCGLVPLGPERADWKTRIRTTHYVSLGLINGDRSRLSGCRRHYNLHPNTYYIKKCIFPQRVLSTSESTFLVVLKRQEGLRKQ